MKFSTILNLITPIKSLEFKFFCSSLTAVKAVLTAILQLPQLTANLNITNKFEIQHRA